MLVYNSDHGVSPWPQKESVDNTTPSKVGNQSTHSIIKNFRINQTELYTFLTKVTLGSMGQLIWTTQIPTQVPSIKHRLDPQLIIHVLYSWKHCETDQIVGTRPHLKKHCRMDREWRSKMCTERNETDVWIRLAKDIRDSDNVEGILGIYLKGTWHGLLLLVNLHYYSFDKEESLLYTSVTMWQYLYSDTNQSN